MNASISGRVGGDEDEGAFARVARPLGAEATTGNLKVKIREIKKKEKKTATKGKRWKKRGKQKSKKKEEDSEEKKRGKKGTTRAGRAALKL